jgi:hypothetical protein
MDLSRNRYRVIEGVVKFSRHAIYEVARLEENYLPNYHITHICIHVDSPENVKVQCKCSLLY